MAIIKTPVDIDGTFAPLEAVDPKLKAEVDFLLVQEGVLFIRAIRLYDENGQVLYDGRWIRIRMNKMAPSREANNRIGVAGYRYKCIALREVKESGEPVERPFSLWREKDKFYVEKEEWFDAG